MNCCTECFESPYLKDIINRAKIVGNCSYCGSKEINTYNPRELSLIFQNILDLYIRDDDDGVTIEEVLDLEFQKKIFSLKVTEKRKELLKDIVSDDLERYDYLFNVKILLKCLTREEHLASVFPLQTAWSEFDNEIKTINRFHLQNILDLEKLKILLSRYKKPISNGKVFFRGRISPMEGFQISEMYNPPPIKTKAGRANPTGISYLYLSDKIKTTLYETRASLYDFVSIGEFRLKKNITVINLKGDDYDPILLAENEELEEFLKYKPFAQSLESELSKPIRKEDKELDYIPTQYLCEFIKSIGYDGVEYRSSLCDDGYNIAIFNPELFECIKVSLHTINKIEFDHNIVKS
ncbi:MAG: RES family NAD+ phosphorylase [Chlorobiaceae bacterium]|nr:RES family NAD+ phosphorylase [Chlorobiaceae bacterium]